MYPTNMPVKRNLKASNKISFALWPGLTRSSCFRTSLFLYHLLSFPHQHPLIQAEPPQATTHRPRFPSPLQRNLWPPEALPGSRRRSGPCDTAPPPGAGRRVGCGWTTAGWRPMPWRDGPRAVIRNWWKAMCWWCGVAN